MDDLFSSSDLDQEMLKAEREKKEEDLAKRMQDEREKKEIKKEKEEREYLKTLYVIDGYSIIYRSYFAFLSRPLTDRDGHNISSYVGFFNTLLMLMNKYTMDYIAVTMDEKEPTFRHIMYPEYKANRDKAPEDLHAQVPMITETLKKMNITVLSKAGFEADDVMASLTRKATEEGVMTIMVTGDKDLLQLVSPSVKALRPGKGNGEYSLYGRDEVRNEYGVYPEQMLDYLSLLGDSADNVPGVKGIGEKGARKLLEEYISLDGIYRNLSNIAGVSRKKLEEGKEMAQLSRKLITLSFDALDDDFDFSSLSFDRVNRENAKKDFEAHQARMLLKRIGEESSVVAESDDGFTKEELALRGEGEYKLVEDASTLRMLFEDAMKKNSSLIAFDTETTGLGESSELVGFSFSYEIKKGYYVPLVISKEPVPWKDEIIKVIHDYITSGRLRVVGQNIKFDLKVLWRIGEDIKNIAFDTMVAAWMLDSNAQRFSLDDLAGKYLGYKTLHFSDVVKNGMDFSDVGIDDAVKYSGEDSDLALRLYKLLSARLKDSNLIDPYMTIELPLIRVLATMERNGILLSDEKMEILRKKSEKSIESLVSSIYQEAGHEFNINSTRQLGTVLFEEKKFETGKKTQRGYSTDVSTLESLRKEGGKIIEDILQYRQSAKLKSTYIDVLPTLKDKDGRIHTSFNQTGTATGRLSSSDPNLQNIPVRTEEGRLIRDAFVAKDGYTFISADYSQVELVMLANMSGDKALSEAFLSGEDVHRYTAGLLFGKKIDEITPSERRIAKTINFGIMYGMSAFRLSNELDISRAEASDFIKKYFDRYSGVKDFVQQTVRSAEEKGYVTTMFGHRRTVIGINSRNKTEKSAAERVAVNTVIQGSASEVMKRAMLALDDKLLDMLLLQVHDELIFECPENDCERLSVIIKETMENTTKLPVPVRASLEAFPSWGGMH